MEKMLELAKNREERSKDSLTAADFASSFAAINKASVQRKKIEHQLSHYNEAVNKYERQ